MSPIPLLCMTLSMLLTVSSSWAQLQPRPAPSKPYRLTRPELTELATQVCATRHNVSEDRINAWQEAPVAAQPGERRGEPPGMGGADAALGARPPADVAPPAQGPALRAMVDCKPHQVLPQYALSYSAQCERKERWLCGPSDLSVRTTLQDRPLLIRTGGYKPELTQDLVQRISVYRTQKGDPVLKPNTSQCSFAKGPEKDLLDVTCEGRVFRLSYWCPKSRCPRIFSIDGYFVPADAGGL